MVTYMVIYVSFYQILEGERSFDEQNALKHIPKYAFARNILPNYQADFNCCKHFGLTRYMQAVWKSIPFLSSNAEEHTCLVARQQQ